jgi:PAS domain S-box-containing protein
MDIISLFWCVLSILTFSLILSLLYLFYKDRDLRKLMFAMGLTPSIFTFLYLGFTSPLDFQLKNTIPFLIFHWGTVPIIECFFFVLSDRLVYRKKDFKLPFYMFLFFYFLSFFIVVSNISADVIYYLSIQIGSLLIIIFCILLIIKERMFSDWLFLLSTCCFAVAGMSLSIYTKQTENISNTILTIFSFFLAYIFLALIFGSSSFFREKEGIGVYFSLENKLKKVEAALSNSEEKYRQVVENLQEGIWVLDTNTSTTYINSFLSQMLGYTTDEIIGKNFFDFMDTTWKKNAEGIMKFNLNDNDNNGYEFEFLRKNKSKMSTYIHMSPLFDGNGKQIGILIGVQDISNRKRMENDLNEKLNKLQKSELATLNIMEDLQNTIVALTTAETQIRQKNEELQMMNQEINIAREQLAILNQSLESKVKERTAEVEKLLKQKDEFIGQLGHDLKTPLTPLNILLPIVKEREQDPKLKELIEIITNNIQFMKNLVIKTLALAQLSSDNFKFGFEEVNLSEQVHGILDLERTFFQGKNVNIQNNISHDIYVQADLIQIKELFDNLISNAIKYSQPTNIDITLDAQKKDDFIVVSIKDKGIGLEANQIEHVFDEFYKVDSSRHDLQSTGLGLPICKRIIEKHGGRIWVESEGKGKGSTFFFTLKTPIGKSKFNSVDGNTNEVKCNTVY